MRQELKDIVFIGSLEYLKREWLFLRNFPQIYILSVSITYEIVIIYYDDKTNGTSINNNKTMACSYIVLTSIKNISMHFIYINFNSFNPHKNLMG